MLKGFEGCRKKRGDGAKKQRNTQRNSFWLRFAIPQLKNEKKETLEREVTDLKKRRNNPKPSAGIAI